MPAAPTATLSGVGQIAYAVENVEQAAAFFRDQLGLRFLFNASPGLSFFDCGGLRLMLCKPQGAGRAGANSVLYFRVDDIHAAHAELSAKGVAFEREPMLIAKLPDHELWMAFFRDPESNLLALMCEKA